MNGSEVSVHASVWSHLMRLRLVLTWVCLWNWLCGWTWDMGLKTLKAIRLTLNISLLSILLFSFFFNLKFESRLDKIFKSICFELLWIYFYFSHGLIIKWRKFYSFSQFFWTNAAASAPNSSSHRISSQQFVAVHEQTFSVCFPLNICSLKISI